MTPFENIYDLALTTIQDYKLDTLAINDEESFKVYLKGILFKAIPLFEPDCVKSLEYNDNDEFLSDLSLLEQMILADSMVVIWFTRVTQDLTQINLALQGRDKKTHQASTNLKEKSEYLDRLREKLRQEIEDYQLLDNNFKAIFGV